MILLLYGCYIYYKIIGENKMNYEDKLRKLIQTKDGEFLTKDVVKEGIPRQYLTILTKKKELERVARGVYSVSDTLDDEMYRIQMRSDKIVFSNETALYMHDLTDRDPLVYSVTVPRGYATNRLRASGLDVTTVKEEFHSLGLEKMKTIHDREVQVYDIDRTICDIVRNFNKMDRDMFYIALKRYAKSKKKNLYKLNEYAKKFRIESKVTQFLQGVMA